MPFLIQLLLPAATYRHCRAGATWLFSLPNSTEVNGLVRGRIQWWQADDNIRSLPRNSTDSIFRLRWIGLNIELLLTFAFVTAMLMVAVDNKSKTSIAPVFIGLALGVCIHASYVCNRVVYSILKSLCVYQVAMYGLVAPSTHHAVLARQSLLTSSLTTTSTG